MENLIQRISRGIDIIKSSYIVFLILCIISSAISVYLVPFLVKGSMTPEQINQELNDMSAVYGGTLTFSPDEIIASIIAFFNVSILSAFLLIIACIVKQKRDKALFRLNRWRDWKFFLYISGVTLIFVDVIQKLIGTGQNDLITNLISTIILAFLTIIFSAILLPEELPEVKI